MGVNPEYADDPEFLARVENLEWLLSFGVAPSVAAVRAGWISASAAERQLQRAGLRELARTVARDRNWTWASATVAYPGEALWRENERVSA